MAALSDFSGALAAGVLAALCTARVLPPEELRPLCAGALFRPYFWRNSSSSSCWARSLSRLSR